MRLQKKGVERDGGPLQGKASNDGTDVPLLRSRRWAPSGRRGREKTPASVQVLWCAWSRGLTIQYVADDHNFAGEMDPAAARSWFSQGRLRIGKRRMEDHRWAAEVSGRLSTFLEGSFTGVQFQVLPLVAYDVATIDVAWTDGPPLHEVDLIALEYVLRLHLDLCAAADGLGPRIDRISKRRTMSPVVENRLLKVLAANLDTEVEDLDMERMYPLPPVLAAARSGSDKGMVPEFLDLLFEATSIRCVEASYVGFGEPDSLLCRCVLCA